MGSFKSFFLHESARSEVSSIFRQAIGGSDEDWSTTISIYADYLDMKGNSKKADLIRYYLEKPEDHLHQDILVKIANSGLSGFASPFGNYGEDLSDGDAVDYSVQGPFFPAHFTVDDLYRYFNLDAEAVERIRNATSNINWNYNGAAHLGVRVPVAKSYATQAFESQKSVRQLIDEQPNLKSRILDYDRMDLDLILPVINSNTGFNRNIPNIVSAVFPHGMNRHQRRTVQHSVQNEFENSGAIPPILGDYEDYTLFQADLRRAGL